MRNMLGINPRAIFQSLNDMADYVVEKKMVTKPDSTTTTTTEDN